MKLKPKKKGYGLEIKTFIGESEQSYLVMRTPDGSFHVFVEVEAKEAARDCGSRKEANTRQMWETLWSKER